MKCCMDDSTAVPFSDFRKELSPGAMAMDVLAIPDAIVDSGSSFLVF